MSELKVHKIGDLCFDFKMGKDVGIDFYLKAEADKVIAELQDEIHNLKRSLIVARHEVAKARGKKSYKYKTKFKETK